MKRRFVLLFVILAILVLPGVQLFAQDAASDASTLPDLEGQEITIAVENAYPPYNFLDEDGNGIGWDYDTFNDICRLINCVPVYQQMAWDGMLIAVSQGQVDVAADGITYTEERDETVDFSTLYQAYVETLLVRGDETRFSTSEELKAIPDYLVGTQLGTTNEITSQEVFGTDHIKSYDQFPAAVQALINGEVDAVEIDRPAGEAYTVTQGNLKMLDESISPPRGFAFAFPPGSPLIDPINQAKAYMEATGRWEQLYVRWFAQPDLPDLEGQEITIAVENAYPPYNFLDEDGNGIGWDYDTFNDICRLINCVPVYQQMAWDGMLIAVSQGQVDVAADGITYTEERDETVDFSTLYQAYVETLLVRGDETRFSTSEELKAIPDYLVGTQLGTTNEITSQEVFGTDHIKSYDQFPAAVQALINGEVDAVEIDRPAGEAYTVTQGNLKMLDESISPPRGFAFAFPPGSPLIDPINQAKAAMEADGTWDDIYRKWFEN